MNAIPLTLANDKALSDVPIMKNSVSLELDELYSILSLLEMRFTLREGYTVKTEGSCSKGPQGQWWNMTIIFETLEGARHAWEVLTATSQVQSSYVR